MRRIIGRDGQVRTSLEGYGVPVPILDGEGRDTGTYTLSDFELKALDFVHADEAALKGVQSGKPIHSTETIQEKPPMSEPTQTPAQPVTPATPQTPVAPVEESKTVRQLQEQIRKLSAQIDENGNKLADFAAICEMLGNPEDPILGTRNVLSDRDNLRSENGSLLKEAIQLQVASKVKLEAARPLIVNMVEQLKPVRKAEVTTALDKVLMRSDVIEMLRVEGQREMGPNQQRPANTDNTTPASESVMFFA